MKVLVENLVGVILPLIASFMEVLKRSKDPQSTAIIEGILGRRQKMILAGPPKAGKSMMLMNLAVCLAFGKEWLGHLCQKCSVLYINLELPVADCASRFKSITEGLNRKLINQRLDILNLRDTHATIDDILTGLIEQCQHRHYDVVIIDPIYKCMVGDENNAENVAAFLATVDKISAALGCAVILSHHYSKTSSGGANAVSGSNVFLRDPDAILTLTPNKKTLILNSMLRNFADIEPMALRFDYPFHTILDAKVDDHSDEPEGNKKAFSCADFNHAFDGIAHDGKAKISNFAKALGCSDKTIYRRFRSGDKCFSAYALENGMIRKK